MIPLQVVVKHSMTSDDSLIPAQVILELFADAAVAAACNILAGVLVLPALSSHALRDALATTLLKLAASVSGYAGTSPLPPPPSSPHSATHLSSAKREAHLSILPTKQMV